jgi:hypothetical protein
MEQLFFLNGSPVRPAGSFLQTKSRIAGKSDGRYGLKNKNRKNFAADFFVFFRIIVILGVGKKAGAPATLLFNPFQDAEIT